MNTEGSRHELTLDLPAAHRGVRVARNVVRHFARMEGVRDGEIEQLVLVVSELLANAIDHGSNGAGAAALHDHERDADERMHLVLVIHEASWQLSVTDQGGGDAQRLRTAIQSAQLPDLDDERGRGLFLLRQMVDTMEVDPSADGRGLTFRVARRHDRG